MEEYFKHGKSDLKNRATLTINCLLEKAYHFFTFRMNKRLHPPTLQYVLLRMLRTGKYMPSSQYIVRGKINGGMEVNRANAVWRVYCQPKATTQEDVATIFFDEELPHMCHARTPGQVHSHLG
jgi:hypothetical protein